MNTDTICALCTFPGKSALSVIRVSGPRALEIIKKQAPFLPDKIESHRVYVGTLTKGSHDIDQAVLTYFEEGKSFTGEETLEISCHGGRVFEEVLKELLKDGARMAKKGEFSFRSVLNGKMDLVQAEGLYQLIESQTKEAHRQSIHQLKGAFSKKLEELAAKWLEVLSHIEAEIDFSTEDLATFSAKDIKQQLLKLQSSVQSFLKKYQPFEKIQQGLTCGLFGPVNSGKSTLFNMLLEEDRAITSGEEGTTRDVIEASLENPIGLNLLLKDTAGFRKSESEGEKKGQQKSQDLLHLCDIQIFVFDCLSHTPLPDFFKNSKANQKKLLVFTKKDLASNKITKQDLLKPFKGDSFFSKFLEDQVFFVSAFKNEGLKDLKKTLYNLGHIKGSGFLVTNCRHYKGLKEMADSLTQCLHILNHKGERDLMALEMRRGLQEIYEILGKQIDDQVLDHIFSQFCIGK